MKKRSFVFYIVFVVMLIVIPCVMIGCGGKEDVCKVSFELNNGQTIVPKYVEKGAVIKVDSPTKKDYTFGGWYTDANLQTQWDIDTHVVEDVMTLYAKWLAHPILTYDLVGGFCKESTSVVMQSTSGGTVTLIDKSKVEKPGFNFLGWSTTIDGSLCANSIEVKKNTTIYAKWQKKTSANTVTNMYYDVLAKLSELEYLAGEFKKTSNVSTSVENLTLNYIRGARYNTTQWNILAGSSNTAFERYVKRTALFR